ncbi:uroporphyrinogen decarboxylase [Hydrogenoanaerobacterium saccharovorans]|uniref:Uroporphyrinogen decarboxylase n=1 Tax=Hydrogenoanaerobacterium saccharovorans TaxID=474960 RepID=A0A1H8E6F4_9FIRM|nr:uroporphyrinogen decarboxylase family protein [Hydrogenoanaerobacterium saccharovorans]RPF41976.1 uroporphyrinogen decarboxylase [Hydrogenoanaerobacterium saccharovorans]SEN15000.1 uroporphyrinogen decarboxylase [Hydrogenoanaerobacterium saccharovorans]
MIFQPDFRNILDAAYNKEAKRLPLYEHKISPKKMEEITGKKFAELYQGNKSDINEFFRNYCGFYQQMGYDTVSFEELIGPAMPGSGALGEHVKGAIQDRTDFERYPWDGICDTYFEMYSKYFEALRNNMPAGMRAIGGIGYGIFECVQDLVGYEDLCYMAADDPELYEEMFHKVGDNNLKIWSRFLREFGDIYCVCRFGDDLGFKSTTLISADDIRSLIIPQYKRIVDEVHSYRKPFLLHSCGCIFDVMDDIIDQAGIDAKHSNEDQIARFPVWVERYGSRIGNFGGIDTDAVCRLGKAEMREYITDVVKKCKGHGGFAFGSGNSIPDYVPAQGYLNMVEIVRELRGDFQ